MERLIRLWGLDALWLDYSCDVSELDIRWQSLLQEQQELLRVYLMALGSGCNPDALARIRALLHEVSWRVESVRRLLSALKTGGG